MMRFFIVLNVTCAVVNLGAYLLTGHEFNLLVGFGNAAVAGFLWGAE